jgi:hypothetical protein
VGSAAAFSPTVVEKKLTVESRNGPFFDKETGSEWNLFGRSIAGQLKGTQLKKVISVDYFWFAWAAFHPDTMIYNE